MFKIPNLEYFWMGAMLMKIVILWNFEYFSIGAMLLKIVILLKWKSGRTWTKFLIETCWWKLSFYEKNWSHMATFHEFDLIGERCEKKWRVSKKETTYGRVQTFFHGGDVHENHHFIGGKLIAHGQILISKYYLLMINFVFN